MPSRSASVAKDSPKQSPDGNRWRMPTLVPSFALLKELFRVALLEMYRTNNPGLTIGVGAGRDEAKKSTSKKAKYDNAKDVAAPYMKDTGEVSQTEGEKKQRMRENQLAADERKRAFQAVFQDSSYGGVGASAGLDGDDLGNRSEFSSKPVLFPPEARREAKHLSTFLPYSVKYRFGCNYFDFFFFVILFLLFLVQEM
jgi:hypothetical protein